jgi:YjbE family integral membrane protein
MLGLSLPALSLSALGLPALGLPALNLPELNLPALDLQEITALLQVILIDITLAGDNAVVVGLAVAGLPRHQKRPAIIAGIGAATVLRIALGAVTLHLLQVVGLVLAGGILLLWVCWKMYRELRRPADAEGGGVVVRGKSLGQAMLQIVLADLSMSLDNVLAVAGAAEGNLWVLVIGLAVSVVLMGVAASLIASLLERHRWIAWVGLYIVLYVALKMIWDGGHEVLAQVGPDWLHAVQLWTARMLELWQGWVHVAKLWLAALLEQWAAWLRAPSR